MALPLIAAEIAGSIALPYILKALGKKALPALAKGAMKMVQRVPAGMVLAKVGAEAPALFSAEAIPAGAVLMQGAGSVLKTPMPLPTAGASALSKIGAGLGAAGTVGALAAPTALSLLGRGMQAAGVGGGALIGAASRLPLLVSQTPAESKARYGATPAEQVAEFVAGLGSAAGVGASALAGAAGSSIDDAARELKLMDMQNAMHTRALSELDQLKELDVRPSDAALYAQMLRSTGRAR